MTTITVKDPKKLVPVDEQKQLLTQLQDGDVFELGKLFQNMAPDESIVWQVAERVQQEGFTRWTLHLYWMDVFMLAVVARMTNAGVLVWDGGLPKEAA